MKNLILRLLLNAFSILYFNFAFAIGLYTEKEVHFHSFFLRRSFNFKNFIIFATEEVRIIYDDLQR